MVIGEYSYIGVLQNPALQNLEFTLPTATSAPPNWSTCVGCLIFKTKIVLGIYCLFNQHVLGELPLQPTCTRRTTFTAFLNLHVLGERHLLPFQPTSSSQCRTTRLCNSEHSLLNAISYFRRFRSSIMRSGLPKGSMRPIFKASPPT